MPEGLSVNTMGPDCLLQTTSQQHGVMKQARGKLLMLMGGGGPPGVGGGEGGETWPISTDALSF